VKKALVLIPVCLAGFALIAPITLGAQNLNNVGGGQIHGNFQIMAQYYNPDTLIGAPPVPEKALMNGWGNINYTRGKFSAGVRYESYLNVLQGFPTGYKGTGIPYRYATYNNDGLEITVGSFYDQFGSGLIFRSYEDRNLGYDNAMDGVRVRFSPVKGLYLKGIWGKQRTFFTTGPGIVRGFDGEANLNELFDSTFANVKTQFILGGSFVSKYQVDQDPLLVLPQNVGAWGARANIIRNRVNFYAEYAYKINDPTIGNNFIYKPGEALYISATYSRKGLGISLAGARIDNFGFRSDRSATLLQLQLNYLPALTKQHTYMLTAYYPFATQPNGQYNWQAEVAYKIKKGTLLGGKYGTDITFNYSAAYALDTNRLNDEDGQRMGYSSTWTPGDSLFFQDVNIEIFHKFNPRFKATLVYANIKYNKNAIEGKIGYPILDAHIVVADLIWRVNDKLTWRSDLEHMYVKDDFGSWAAALFEFTFGENYFVALTDQWNYGNYSEDHRIHYFSGMFGYMKGTNRIVLGYGKQRAGIFCVGGVCRFVPASNGFSLTISSSF
jgi:hypothetical protein